MEFRFNVNDIFKQPIVEIGPSLVPPGVPYTDKRALWDAVNKVSEIINTMGNASAAAQGLNKPITTSERLRNSEQKLYFLIDPDSNNGRGAVTGMLKTGKKGLYVFDREGHHYQVQPSCVLDFYIHESKQRMGLGKVLFEHMLAEEKVEPVKLAIDRPSDKFLGFLNKHYALDNPVRQMNNFVVFDGFFPEPVGGSAKGDNSEVPTTKSNQAANGLQSNFTSPYGRYGAPRPPCSMGQIIHNQSPMSHQAQEPSGTSLCIKTAPKIRPKILRSDYHGHISRVIENSPNTTNESKNVTNNKPTVQEGHSKSVVVPPAHQDQQQQLLQQQQQQQQQLLQQMYQQQLQQQQMQQIQQSPSDYQMLNYQNYQYPAMQPQYAPQQITMSYQQPILYQQPVQYQQQVPQENLQSHVQQEQFRTLQPTQAQQQEVQKQQAQNQLVQNEQEQLQKQQKIQQQQIQQQQVQQQQIQQQQIQQQQLQQQQLQQQQAQQQQAQQQQGQQQQVQQQQAQQQQAQQQQVQKQQIQQQQQIQTHQQKQVQKSHETKQVSNSISDTQTNQQQSAQRLQYVQPPYEGQVAQQREQPIQDQPKISQQLIPQPNQIPMQQITQYQPQQQNVEQLNQQSLQYLAQPIQQLTQQPIQQLVQQPMQQMTQPIQQLTQQSIQQLAQQPIQYQQPAQQMMQQPIQYQQVPQQIIQQPVGVSNQQIPMNYMHPQQSIHQIAIPSKLQVNTTQPVQHYNQQQLQVPLSNQQLQTPILNQQIQYQPVQSQAVVQPSQHQMIPIGQVQQSLHQLQSQIPTIQQQLPQIFASQPNLRVNQQPHMPQVVEAQSAINTTTYSTQNAVGYQQHQQHRTQVPPQSYRTQDMNNAAENIQGNVQVSASYTKVGSGINNMPNAGGDMQPIEAR